MEARAARRARIRASPGRYLVLCTCPEREPEGSGKIGVRRAGYHRHKGFVEGFSSSQILWYDASPNLSCSGRTFTSRSH